MPDDPRLRRVSVLSARHHDTKAERDDAIRSARRAGHSLRVIAKAAGLSFAQIANITREGK